MPNSTAVRFSDRVWRFLQGKRLRDAEREVVVRTLRLLDPSPKPDSVTQASQREAWLTGEALVEEGDIGSDLFMVLDGTVEIVVGGRVVERMGPGEVFGEIGMLARAPRSATVRAQGRVVALRIPEDAVDDSLREALWEYAGERRFLNLPFAPVADADARRRWWMNARHAHLGAGDIHAGAPWIFVYHGTLIVDGQQLHAPSLGEGGTLHLDGPARFALLPEP